MSKALLLAYIVDRSRSRERAERRENYEEMMERREGNIRRWREEIDRLSGSIRKTNEYILHKYDAYKRVAEALKRKSMRGIAKVTQDSMQGKMAGILSSMRDADSRVKAMTSRKELLERKLASY